jgi:membrane protein implicated in regulation of membrane protease activity
VSLMFWIWVVLAAVFMVAGILTAGFFLLPLGVGAGVAAILNAAYMPSWLQWLAFIVVSGVLGSLGGHRRDFQGHQDQWRARSAQAAAADQEPGIEYPGVASWGRAPS